MEDDDEFGDLYTDVLRPFQSSSSSAALHPPPTLPIDLNIQSDDEEILYGASNSNPNFNSTSSHHNQTLAVKPDLNFGFGGKQQEVERDEGLADGSRSVSRVLERGGGGVKSMDEAGIDGVVEEGDEKDDGLVEKGEGLIGKNENIEKFDVEEVDREVLMDKKGKFDVEDGDTGIEEIGSGPLIPGITGVSNGTDSRGDANLVRQDDVLVEKDEVLVDNKGSFEKFDVEEVDTGIVGEMGLEPLIPGITGASNGVDNRGEEEDWDSDSEDDLQIVLNDNNQMMMDRAGEMGSDDEDEDGDPLVIVADSEPGHQPMEEQEWGEDAGQAMDGERRELGDAAKVNGGVVVPPKLGYSSHAYHPYHSQFKYVRPGAAPIPGAAPVGPGGPPGQVRPSVNMGPGAGRGRGGDWRPLQKSFHPGYGMPVWGNNTSARGFGSGLDFTLPSHKTIFEVDVNSFEEKPWRLPGIDVSDFFNFSLNEESWKDYCKQLEQLRMETTMQSKIRVYESGRTEQEYDPDLPPELAAAAAIHDISSENANLVKMDAGQSDLSKGSARVRPPLPTGRAIQVETGYGERLPSIDTRPPRIRDADAIIEIVLQGSADDDSSPGNDVREQTESDHSREDFGEGRGIEGDAAEKDAERFEGFPQAYNGRKKELVGRTVPFMNSVQDNLTDGDDLPLPPEAPVKFSPNSRGKTSSLRGREDGTIHEERRTKGRARDRSPHKRFLDNQKEDSVESIGRKNSSQLSSPDTVGSAEELDVEHGDHLPDELMLADGNSELEAEEMPLDTIATDTQLDENALPYVKKQKLNSRVEQSSLQEIDGGDLNAARSSENSKARSGSSRNYQKLRDSVEKEVVQHEHSTRMGNLKRPHGEAEQSGRRKGRDERREMEKHHLVEKVREDSYPRRDWDPYSAHHLHGKSEGLVRRKERENSEGSWQQREVDPHGRRTRAEDTKKRERDDEIASRNRNKVRESERIDKEEHLQLSKQLDNGNLRGLHDKDVESRRRERDDYSKTRHENMDDLHRKRRGEEEYLRRDAGKEEILHGHRENTSRSKRERDDALDMRKRDDQVRTREDDRHSVRHKEEGWIPRERGERQRERDELLRIKQSHDESLVKREREDGRGGVRSGRAAEDKSWVSHTRVKDDYKDSDRDYQFKETARRSEQLERRDRIEDGRSSQYGTREDVHTRRSQLSNNERRSRHERAGSRGDRVVSGSDNDRAHDKKHKENTRKSKESEGGDQNSMGPSKRNLESRSGQMNEPVILKGATERGNSKHEVPLNRHSSKRHREDASSDDEQQDSKRGRSKLERWTSHKERDFIVGTKSSSSLKVKEIDKDNNGGSSSSNKKLPDEPLKTVETTTNKNSPGDEKDAGDLEVKNVDAKSLEDKHSDTVAKLKKRSERFKLPMPSEKEAMVIKKMESEPLPSAQNEPHADSEIKPERPARKRRWISN